MKKLGMLLLILGLSVTAAEARIKFLGFENESSLKFEETFVDGRLVDQEQLIDQEGAVLVSKNEHLKIILEDAQQSGFHRPHWKFNVWLESDRDIPIFNQNRLLYAVIFYDGDGEVKLHLDKDKKLHIVGGFDVADILYPWAKGIIGRGNPYHEIAGQQTDANGIKFFDYNGFV